MLEKIIFTDLDGTLLDHDTYSYKEALPALKIVRKKKIPLVICTSKTRAEIEVYRKRLKNKDPFISENGGAIFIPKGYFDFKFRYDEEDKDYLIIKLGTDYRKLTGIIQGIKKEYPLMGFSDMRAEELARDAGLTLAQARLAKKREFDEAFRIMNNEDEKYVLNAIKKNRLNYTIGGRYFHIMGKSDKGKAVSILSNLFKKKFRKIKTIACGDSANDFSMLDNADVPYLVMKKDRHYASKKYHTAGAPGPKGWNKAVLGELK